MADDYSIFGQLTRLNPSGSARDAKEVPVDRDARRRGRRRKKAREPFPGEEPEKDREEEEGSEGERRSSGKVVDIII